MRATQTGGLPSVAIITTAKETHDAKAPEYASNSCRLMRLRMVILTPNVQLTSAPPGTLAKSKDDSGASGSTDG